MGIFDKILGKTEKAEKKTEKPEKKAEEVKVEKEIKIGKKPVSAKDEKEKEWRDEWAESARAF